MVAQPKPSAVTP
uniref:Uncharacterized protein n=1 Tax=Rhizophora mucronata TaxID=61149 RepID=A0A2P2Q0V3_RHIMU